MKQKKEFKIFIGKSLVLVFFVLFFLFTSNVFAATNLTELPQPTIINTLKTQNEVTLLNALNNANVISKLSVPATIPSLKNNIIHPLFKFNKVSFSLLGSSIVSLGNSITSDYNDFILQPVSDVETSALLMMGDGLISMGNVTNSIYSNYVSFPKLAFSKPKISLPKINPPNGKLLATVVGADVNYYVTDYNDFILQPVSKVETTALLMMGDGLISMGNVTDSIFSNYVSFPKLAFSKPKISLPKRNLPHTSAMASVIASNITPSAKNISNTVSVSIHSFSKKIGNSFKIFFHNVKNKTIAFFVDMVNGVKFVFTGTIHARNELCINTTCVTEAQLQTLLKNSETNNSSINTTATASLSNTPTTQN